MKRRDDELPVAVDRWGWRYHHTGIPTEQKREGETYLPEFGMYVCGFPDSPYGIEWMRFEPDSPISQLVQTVPHVAFEVDSIEQALQGKSILTQPCSPSPGVTVFQRKVTVNLKESVIRGGKRCVFEIQVSDVPVDGEQAL